MKTKPHTIRFEESDYDFICKRENLQTAQSILDFLMTEYIKIYKVQKPSIFLVPKESDYDGKETNRNSLDEPLKFEEPKRKLIRTFEQYRQLKLDCENEEDWNTLADEIRDAPNLSTKQKQLLLN